jgi:cobalt/nickel transport system permease protein
MIDINASSYDSPLRKRHPREKVFTTGLALGVVLFGPMPLAPIGAIIWMGYLLCGINKTPITRVVKLMAIPMAFMCLSVLTLVFYEIPRGVEPIFAIPIGTSNWGITPQSLTTGLQVSLKAIASLICLYFLILTTPMTAILSILKGWSFLKLIVELMELTYKMIFLLYDTTSRIYNAQKTRLGYDGVKASFRDLSVLASMAFKRAFKRSDALYTALEARGYEGDLLVLEETYATSKWGYLVPTAVTLLILTLAFWLKL